MNNAAPLRPRPALSTRSWLEPPIEYTDRIVRNLLLHLPEVRTLTKAAASDDGQRSADRDQLVNALCDVERAIAKLPPDLRAAVEHYQHGASERHAAERSGVRRSVLQWRIAGAVRCMLWTLRGPGQIDVKNA